MLHRSEDDAEATENRRLITKVLSTLRQCPDSVLASRGVFLIKSLLKGGRKHRDKSDTVGLQGTLAWPLESREDIDALRTNETSETGSQELPSQELPLQRQTGVTSDAGLDVAEKPSSQSAMDVDMSGDMSWFDLSGDMSWFNFSDYFPSTPAGQHDLDLEDLFKIGP